MESEERVGGKKRKYNGDDDLEADKLEIDLHAPEPASKKALRKAKRVKAIPTPDVDKRDVTDQAPVDNLVEKPSPKQTSKRSPHGVWIGNLPFFIKAEELQTFLTGDSVNSISSSQITRIHLPQGPPKPGTRFQNKGFAYVDLQSAEAVETALNLSEKLFGGRRVLIKSSQNFQGRPESTSKTTQAQQNSSLRIFIGNLDFDTTKEDLERHFAICGGIDHLQVATFEDSGKCKGYAWVQFEQLSSAEAAIRGWVEVSQGSTDTEEGNDMGHHKKEQKGKKRFWTKVLDGRKLRMEYAEDKVTRYKKRFGKPPRSEEVENSDAPDISAQKPTDPKNGDRILRSVGAVHNGKRPTQDKPPVPAYSRYSAASVQKITGAITEGQGSKTTFE